MIARPLTLDAAHGTRLIAQGLRLDRDDPALWVLDRPEFVFQLHQADIAAGADALLTCTFGASSERLTQLNRRTDQDAVHRAAVELARAAAGPDRLVIGDIGPHSDPKDNARRAEAMLEAGADALLLETYPSELAIAALSGWAGRRGIRVWVSLYEWPEPVEPIAQRLAELGAEAIGTNCRTDLQTLAGLARRLQGASGLPILVKPSGGLPGQPPIAPEAMARLVPDWLEAGARLIGSCCGSTSDHVSAIRQAISVCRF